MKLLIRLSLLLIPSFAWASFDSEFQNACERARRGRPYEARAILVALSDRIEDLSAGERPRRVERLCRALEYLGDKEHATTIRRDEAERALKPARVIAAVPPAEAARSRADALFALASDSAIGHEMQKQLYTDA